jgi:transcriptional coactivator HFI1/ADA1
MPVVVQQIMLGYREGEVESWEDYSWPEPYVRVVGEDVDADVDMGGVNGVYGINGANGHPPDDNDDYGWEGADPDDKLALDSLLDSCLAIGS